MKIKVLNRGLQSTFVKDHPDQESSLPYLSL